MAERWLVMVGKEERLWAERIVDSNRAKRRNRKTRRRVCRCLKASVRCSNCSGVAKAGGRGDDVERQYRYEGEQAAMGASRSGRPGAVGGKGKE